MLSITNHKITFNYAPRKAESVGANCSCGWVGFTNTKVVGGVVKAKASLKSQHQIQVGA